MVAYACLWAYRIRMHVGDLLHFHGMKCQTDSLRCYLPWCTEPVRDYGYLIHEFDPWPAWLTCKQNRWCLKLGGIHICSYLAASLWNSSGDFAFVFNGAVFYSGRIVHNFVARFNFRVAQYLAKNGWFKFAKWFASQTRQSGREWRRAVWNCDTE